MRIFKEVPISGAFVIQNLTDLHGTSLCDRARQLRVANLQIPPALSRQVQQALCYDDCYRWICRVHKPKMQGKQVSTDTSQGDVYAEALVECLKEVNEDLGDPSAAWPRWQSLPGNARVPKSQLNQHILTRCISSNRISLIRANEPWE